ncbi:heparinase II/III family protein [Novosphingobium aquimarinum]|uniref:heparinase II/III family protein n=1 Tax=Novosphingobium aquimarinum TaxID=2682494 RepID=UPI001E391ACD|nr:heparinase II/III family protein [Novosphingobium aquimarinum]
MAEAVRVRRREPRSDGPVAMPLIDRAEEGITQDSTDQPSANAAASVDGGEASHAPDQVIRPGRALALTDFVPPRASAGEKLIRLAYKMGMPASMLTSRMGRKVRLRLLATVENPLPGNRVTGTALRAGHFFVHGAKLPIAQVDYQGAARATPPLERVVHGFTWLADLEASAPREQTGPVAERIAGEWLDANVKAPTRPGKGPAWTVGNTGTRLINWLVHAPLLLGGEAEFRGRMLRAMEDAARWLDHNVTKAEDGLAEVAGWCGIVAAGLLLPEGRPRRLFGEAGLAKALGELVGEDGGLLSRSPLMQMDAIALLVKLRACYAAMRHEFPEPFEQMLAFMVPPLLALTHGNGSLGSWQGAWAVPAEELARLVDASKVRARPLRDVRQWGYQRIAARKSILMVDVAPPPLARHARYGCASTLAFELSHAGQRIVANCGGAACAGGLVPVRLEQGLRATAAHSTMTLDDANSTAVLINGAIGSGVSQVDVDRRSLELEGGGTATRIEASHNGYATRYGLEHRRILIMRDDGTELRGEDLLVPSGRKGKRGKVAFAIRFHLGAGVEVRLGEDRMGAGLALPDGSYWQFRSTGVELEIEDSLWVDGGGRPVATQQLVVQGLVSRGGGNFGWLFKKMS